MHTSGVMITSINGKKLSAQQGAFFHFPQINNLGRENYDK